jgi:hypothetical protein
VIPVLIDGITVFYLNSEICSKMFEILILMDSREKKKILTQSLDVEDKKYRTTLYRNISKKITVICENENQKLENLIRQTPKNALRTRADQKC